MVLATEYTEKTSFAHDVRDSEAIAEGSKENP